MKRWTLLGAVLLLLSILGWRLAPRLFLAGWLSAWWWCLGLILGCWVNAWMYRLTGGDWGEPFALLAPRLASRLPWLLLALVPVLLGVPLLYPWATDRSWLHEVARPGFPKLWLSQPFFFGRLALYALACWWLARGLRDPRKGRAAASLLAYAVVGTLGAVDLLMSLLPRWYSTAFGLVSLSQQALAGAALGTLAASFGPRPAPWRDLGNLLLMWTMSWAYLAFMQFLIIWAENLPREIAWYVPRMQTGWRWAGLALVLLQLAIPFSALLLRAVKDHPSRLRWVAVLLLVASALNAAWTIVPSVAPENAHALWLLPLLFAGAALLFLPGRLHAEA